MIPAAQAAAVAAGAAAGALARTLVGAGLADLAGPGFPLGTLAANVAGSFLIGLYAGLAEPGGPLDRGPLGRLFVATGFCGGFTTFSLFSLDTLLLLERGAHALAAASVAATLGLSLAAVSVGNRLAGRLLRSRAASRP